MGLLQFLFDKTGGNRIGQFEAAGTAHLLPEQPLYGFGEVLYASAAQYWGWAGLVAFTLIMVSPVILLLWDQTALDSPLRRAALKGLMIYIVMAGIDGALDFIPVMAFYWFVYSVFLFGWPGRPVVAVRQILEFQTPPPMSAAGECWCRKRPLRACWIRPEGSGCRPGWATLSKGLHPFAAAAPEGKDCIAIATTHPRHRWRRLYRLELHPRLARARSCPGVQPGRAHLRRQPCQPRLRRA